MSSHAGPAGSDNRIVAHGFDGTWAQLDGRTTLALPPAGAVLANNNFEAAQAVWAHATGERETLIASPSRIGDDQALELRRSGLAVVRGEQVEPALIDRAPEVGRIWLLTSGSTGRPKQVAHTLESLTTVRGEQPPRTWLCPYATGAYAWWQVVTMSLSLPGQDVLFVEPGQMDSWPQQALDAGVTAASGTPTFWRQALWRSAETVAQLDLRQVTLGGEPVDQSILDRLHEVFPKARVSWIYASSEAGAAIAVHDGRAGFPTAWLDREVNGRPRLSVQDDELIISSQHAAEGMSGAIRTGDHVEVADERVLITGRIASDEINVGGSKASAAKVRAVLLEHPKVAWATVRGRKAPLVGNVVTAQVVLDAPDAVSDADLVAWCAERLPDYAVPRRLRLLPEIPIKETLKSDV
ncbi:AMP-binding protein [Leekyejoonella antrihumi]|uniref:Long-chain fatty acid--CoA ligase n=1 Tax=Leekyejoonella antrihumi TaxID=1660198 RepID=A0A563DXX0_9MICO|nr:AMP-binding protein [Leekyejoonella antrihumi]TWP35077.1 long-chain fatty acid--CoA ligase [Leekyejoonella antrihumi]